MHSDVIDSNGKAGFSLVETLVALSVFSLLTIVLLGAFQQLRPLYTASKFARERTELHTIADFLANAIEYAIPLTRIDTENSDRRIAFEGNPAGVRFVGPLRVGSDETGLQAISITLVQNDQKGQLLLETMPRRTGNRESVLELLVSDLKQVRFEFLAGSGTPATGWTDQWTRPDQMPEAVRITFHSKSTGPELKVRRTIFLKNAIHSLRRSAS